MSSTIAEHVPSFTLPGVDGMSTNDFLVELNRSVQRAVAYSISCWRRSLPRCVSRRFIELNLEMT